MALTENNYVGNGSTVLYSFTFPYLATTDIKVSLDGVVTTSYTLANATTVQFNAAPTNGTKIRIYRETADGSLSSTFYPGSSIRSQDLNNNFTQNLYVTQEARNTAASATSTANSAVTTSNTALSQSAVAVSTANTASSNATAAVNTSNSASAAAASAVSTANTASANSTTAINTANSAVATANTKGDAAIASAATANTTAASAVSTANAATATANNAVSIANTKGDSAIASAANANNTAGNALTAANNAVNIANTKGDAAIASAATANTTAASAVSTANSAVTTASSAAATATTANNKADQAIAAVSNSINYQLKANVAAIPASPANDTYIEVQDSTGLESFTPLAGKPAGFVGDAGLSVRLRYTSAGSTWNWLNYYANNSDSRYLKLAGGTVSGNVAVTGTLTKGGSNVVTVGDTGTVTSTMIADGTILNADVNAAAAIAGTKISPDFGSQNVTTTGTVTGASLSPTSSTAPTNGVYLPAANTVGISTGGSGRLFINSAGNVGIGAANTGAAFLEVGGSLRWQTQGIFRNSTNTSTLLRFAEIGSRDVRLDTWDGTDFIGTIRHGAQTYLVETGTGASLTERLRITSAGLVGVGTSVPRSLLSLGAATATATATPDTLDLGGTYSTTAGANPKLRIFFDGTSSAGFGLSANQLDYISIAGNSHVFYAGTSQLMKLDSSGRLGIGSSVPGATLDVRSGTDNSTIFKIDGGGGGNRGLVVSTEAVTVSGSGFNDARIVYNAQSNTGGSARGEHDFRVNGTSALKIDYQNRVGIGIATPGYPLEIRSSSGDGNFVVGNASGPALQGGYSTGGSASYLQAYNTASSAFIDLNINGSSVRFGTGSGATERARIDSSGNLCIGASSFVNGPKLGVRGNTNLASSQAVVPSSSCGLVISSTSGGSADNGGALWFDHGDLFSGIAGSRVSTGNWGTDLRFYTHPDSTTNQYTLPERMRIDSSGRLGLGTSSPSTQLTVYTANPGGPLVTIGGANSGGGSVTGIRMGYGDGSAYTKSAILFENTDGAYAKGKLHFCVDSVNDSGNAVLSDSKLAINHDGELSAAVAGIGGTTLYPAYLCRAWVNFNGTGTVAIRANGNVSSITDNGTGDYTVNFTTAMPDANYGVSFVGQRGDGTGKNYGWQNIYGTNNNTQSATSSSIRVMTNDSGGNPSDYPVVYVAIFR